MVWLEGSILGHAMRSSGVWTYALVNLAHILGVSALFGSVLALDLRLLGVWGQVPLVSVSGTTVPIARVGFAIALVSGVGLLATKATEYIGNPFLLIKFPAIAIALINVAVIERLPGWKARAVREPTDPERRQLAIAGLVSVVSWLTAVTAGRMIGYW
jgi:hypothetical protein